jgi:hypothetical protein
LKPLDSVDDVNKAVNGVADDIPKRVATRLVASCNKFKQPRLDQILNYGGHDAAVPDSALGG